jgi:hypothetical protein
MPTLPVSVTPRIADLLNAGEISISVTFYSSGIEVYGRTTKPHPRLGVQPHESMTLEDLEASLGKVRVDNTVHPSPHGGAASGGTPAVGGKYKGPMTAKPDESGKAPMVKKGQAVSVLTRNDPEIGKVPVQIGIHGVMNILPKSSICWKDLMCLNDDQLFRRILSVGREIGADKAVSRTVTNGELSTIESTSLTSWWRLASPEQRFILISDAKKRGTCFKGDQEALLARLTPGRYPFRGTDLAIQEGEIEEEFEEEDLTAQQLEIDFDELVI